MAARNTPVDKSSAKRQVISQNTESCAQEQVGAGGREMASLHGASQGLHFSCIRFKAVPSPSPNVSASSLGQIRVKWVVEWVKKFVLILKRGCRRCGAACLRWERLSPNFSGCCEKRVLKAVAVPGAIPLLRSPS